MKALFKKLVTFLFTLVIVVIALLAVEFLKPSASLVKCERCDMLLRKADATMVTWYPDAPALTPKRERWYCDIDAPRCDYMEGKGYMSHVGQSRIQEERGFRYYVTKRVRSDGTTEPVERIVYVTNSFRYTNVFFTNSWPQPERFWPLDMMTITNWQTWPSVTNTIGTNGIRWGQLRVIHTTNSSIQWRTE